MKIIALRCVYVGLDYHQGSVQVCVMDSTGKVLVNCRCENDWRRIRALVAPHAKRVFAAIEACCGAADLAEELIAKARWSVALAHPGYVQRMRQNQDKTDSSDARLLADLERVGYLPRVWLAPSEVRELRRLVRFRQQNVDRRRSVKLRIRALLRDHRLQAPQGLSSWTKAWMQWLRESLARLGEQSRWILEQHLSELEHLERLVEQATARLGQAVQDDALVSRLLQEKGIGPITAAVMRAEIGRFDRFRTGKQLARFCGLSPRNASSGERQADAGLIKAGNPQLRAVVIELAQRLVNAGGRWTQLAQHMSTAGKHRNVIVAAVGNRYLRWLYYQMQELRAA